MKDILIPDDACVRVTFESAVSIFFGKLAEQLQTNAEGVFFIQQDPLARQGCCPFHIKLIASNSLAGISYKTISGIMRDVGLLCKDAKGHVLPVCVVDSKGLVSLKISSTDCVLIGKQISQLLFDTNGWCPDHEISLLVNIGTFHGPHRSAFEVWLNGELRSNSSAFPPFHAEFLELSKKCGNFLEEPVRLLRRSSSPEIRSVIKDKQDTSNHASKSRDFESILNSSELKEQSNRKRFVALVTSITKKMRGAGIVKALNSKVERYSITPIDLGQWHSDCKKVTSILDEMLCTIGPKEFLNVLDSVANLNNPDSLSSALLPQVGTGRGRSLVLTRILDLHIEATTNFESNGAISNDDSHLNGVVVSLSIGSIIKTTDTCVQMNEGLGSNPNPNPLNFDKPSREFVCLLSSGNQTLADSRAQLSTQLYPNRALIALYVNSDSMTSLGLQPYNGRSAFYLPIAWIDIKDKNDRNGPINAPTRGMIHDSHRRIESSAPASLPSFRLKCADAIEKENHMRNYSTRFRDGNGCEIIDMESSTNVGHRNERSPSLPQQRLRSGQGVFHIGDWICPECKALVYSFRPDCFRCRTLRPDTGPHIVPRQPKKTALRPEGDVREGDWNCLSCKGHNFADKLACFTCRAPRPQAPIEVSQHLECTERDEHINFETNTISTKGRGVESVVGSGSIEAGIKVGAVVVFPKAPEKFLRSMPGDWTCPSCKEIVFAKRYRCYKCSALRIR